MNRTYLKLLFGSFAGWHMATREQRQDETSEVKSVADGIIAVLRKTLPSDIPIGPIRMSAILRVAKLWSLFSDRKDQAPNTPYYYGILMDLHQAIMWYPHRLTLHKVYVHNLAPEQQTIDQIPNDNVYPLGDESIKELWKTYISPSKDPVVSTRGKRGRKACDSAKVQGTVLKGLFYGGPSASDMKGGINFKGKQNPATFSKIITKGMPQCTTARAIRKLLWGALVVNPEENDAVLFMVRQFMIGAYSNTLNIATPTFRTFVYGAQPRKFHDILDTMENRHLYAIVAEHVIGMALRIPALHSILSEYPQWETYVTSVQTMCNNELRPYVYKHHSKMYNGVDHAASMVFKVPSWNNPDIVPAFITRSAHKDDIALLKASIPLAVKWLSAMEHKLQPNTTMLRHKNMPVDLRKCVSMLSPHGVSMWKVYMYELVSRMVLFHAQHVPLKTAGASTSNDDRALGEGAVMWMLLDAFMIKRTLRGIDMSSAKICMPNLATAMKIINTQSTSFRIYRSILEAIHIPEDDIDLIESTLLNLK
jgi:hypothetical protein